jgi:hypothetical protein
MMSKNECLSANWEFIGQQDGISGAGSLAQRTTVCAKHNVVMDRALYAEGYKKGVRTYCSQKLFLNMHCMVKEIIKAVL